MTRLLLTLTLLLTLACALLVAAARAWGAAHPGALLAYQVTVDSDTYVLYVRDLRTGIRIGLARRVSSRPPIWSLDGRLAFVSARSNNGEIYVWDGVSLTNLSQHMASDDYPAWSTDGRLAFMSNRDANLEIYIMGWHLVYQHLATDCA